MLPSTKLSSDRVTSVQPWLSDYRSAWQETDGRVAMEAWLHAAPEEIRPRLFMELLSLDGQLRHEQTQSHSSFMLSVICPMDAAIGMDDASNEWVDNASADNSASAVRRSLLGCPTFAALSEPAAARLDEALEEVTLPAETTILQQGQPAAGLFVIVSGRLKIQKVIDRKNQPLAECGAQSVLGEMSLLTGQPCTANVITQTPVKALRLSTTDYDQLQAEFPELVVALSQLVSDRLGNREIDALCGRTLHGYKLRRRINRGGMGVVYEGHHEDSPQQPKAIKMLLHRFTHQPDAVEHFQTEVSTLGKLRHENIISVYDAFVDFQTRFLVMQYCDGEDLESLVGRLGPLPEKTVRAILGQITRGLNYVHRKKVVHLDMKPQNVLLDRSGVIAISDFGLCEVLGQHATSEMIKGTPQYMPPEQLRGDAVDRSGDWYAVGCLAYQLLTGQTLFRGQDIPKLYEQKQSTLTEIPWGKHKVTELLDKVIADSLHPEPSERRWDIKKVSRWAKPVPEMFTQTA